jgi:hypothetical protein
MMPLKSCEERISAHAAIAGVWLMAVMMMMMMMMMMMVRCQRCRWSGQPVHVVGRDTTHPVSMMHMASTTTTTTTTTTGNSNTNS